jgi:hypothetical protein
MKPKFRTSRFLTHSAGASLITAIQVCFTGLASAADWNGSVSTDWNTASNWTPAVVPSGVNVFIKTVTPNFTTISANITATPVDIFVGQGGATTGRLDHTAGTAKTGAGNWMFVGVEGGTGVYNIANTAASGGTLTGFGTGTGSLTEAGRLYVGGSWAAGGGNGTMNINTSGTMTTGDLTVGSSGGTGVVNMDAGTVNTGGWNFIGKREGQDGGNGTLNLGGGTINNTGARTFIGLGNTTGTFNLSGGTYNNVAAGDNTFFGIGINNNANATTPNLNVTGGTLNVAHVLSAGGIEAFGGNTDGTFIGSGKGNLTVNGIGALVNVTGELWAGQGTGSVGNITVSNGALQVNTWVAVGRGGGTGTLTINGGTLTKTGSGSVSIGSSGTSNGTH